MGVKIQTIFLAVLQLCLLTLATENGSNRPFLALDYLGLVDGKAFYADTNVTKNWTEAKAYCESVDLTLATVTSLNQSVFLNETLRQYSDINRFWTAGHESRNISIIEWDDGTNRHEKLDSEVLSDWKFVTFFPFQYCGSLQIYYENLTLVVTGCDNEFWTLCQTKNLAE